MDFVLKNKWNSCNKFRQYLMCTEGSTIAEATQDLFWGVGVAPNLAQFTRPSIFLGKNQLGRALMSIRNYVSLNELTKPDDIFNHLCPPIKLASSSPASTSVTVTPLSLVPDTASSSGSEGELIKCMKTILDDKSLNSEATTNLQEPLLSQLPNKPPRKTKTKPVSVSCSISVHIANYTDDRSVLCDIDPDLYYYYHNNSIKSEYYTEKQFNNTFSDNNNLSILHLNIRSVPLHFSEFLCFLDTLDIEFKIIALSETGINIHHAVYNITHNLEMDHRHTRRGGGVSLYIHNILQYKIRKDLVIGDVVNSVFI